MDIGQIRKGNTTMTKSQERVIERIRTEVLKTFDFSNGKGEYEYKQFEVHDCKYFIAVVAEVGRINDEGTLASMLCRNRVHLFIGKRGAITYPVNTKDGKVIRKPFKGYWKVYMEQK